MLNTIERKGIRHSSCVLKDGGLGKAGHITGQDMSPEGMVQTGGALILTGLRPPLVAQITGRRWSLENGPVFHQWNWWKGIIGEVSKIVRYLKKGKSQAFRKNGD